jgi:hypothetical protein
VLERLTPWQDEIGADVDGVCSQVPGASDIGGKAVAAPRT